MIYGEKLNELRETRDLKQVDIANILKIKRGVYSQYEIEDKIIPLYHLNTLANFFDVSIDYILGLNDIKRYSNYIKIDEINKSLVGSRLKEFRKENKVTLVKLAELLNTTHSTLSAYESGKTCILTSFLYTICKKYKISADYLLGKIDDPKYLKKKSKDSLN